MKRTLILAAFSSSMLFGQLLFAQTQLSAQAQQARPEEFDSPNAAAQALIDAASKDDTRMLAQILGSREKGILTSGNEAQDKTERMDFVRLATGRHHTEQSSMNDKMAVLLIGEEDYPFPIPIVRTGDKWHFDPQLGQAEMRARRVGSDELDAIDICFGYATAQQEYAARQAARAGQAIFAQTIQQGLYQPNGSDKLVPAGLAEADASAPAAQRKPYHGYFFKVLKQQGADAPGGAHSFIANGKMIGGFALIAWPAEYGVTGVSTFIISNDDQVYEKDLGPKTDAIAPTVSSYNPDNSWMRVDERDSQ